MALGIYKPGQGYWVRVLTATLIGVITLALAAWMWSQMGLLASKLPRKSYLATVEVIDGPPAPGQPVNLSLKGERTGVLGEQVGTAVIENYDATTQSLWIKDISITKEGADPTSIGSGGTITNTAGANAMKATVKGAPVGIPPVTPQLLQGAGAGAVILLGFIIAYYLAAIRPGFVEFLISTDMEMKKVNWSTRRDITKSTWVVIAAAFLIAGSLFLVDYGFQAFFRAIGVLTY
jgi:preprotein translocase SecE subunit